MAVVVAAAVLVGCSSGGSSGKTSAPNHSVTTTTVPRTYSARVVRETEVSGAFRQGLARDGDGWAFSVNDGLYRTDDAFNITTKMAPAIPAEWKSRGYDHLGDIDVVGDVLYAPLEQPNYNLGKQAMLLYDARTLTYERGLEIAQHENSFVTVDPATQIAYSFDHFGGSAFTRYDIAHDWRPLAPLRMSRFVDKVQGADVRDGAVWLSTDDTNDEVYRVDLANGRVQALGSVGHVDGEGEGIDATPTPNGDLHVLDIDVKIFPVRVIELKVTATPASP